MTKKKRVFYLGLLFCSILLLTGCGTKKDVIYFQGLDKLPKSIYLNDSTNYELKIVANDNLLITVSTLNPEAASIFNASAQAAGATNNTMWNLRGYLVDEEGNINFPVIGKIHLAGLTKQEAMALIESKISKYVENPVVNIRYMNYKIYILGEVSSPGEYTVSDEKISIPEALAMAHDLTILGDRRNIDICRVENGEKRFYHVDMTSPDIFFSKNYYLQQNDIIYVHPNGTKARNYRSLSSFTSVISLVASLASLYLTMYALLKK